MKFICYQCGKKGERPTGEVNRALRGGFNLHCDRICAGLSRRKPYSLEDFREKKRLYDIEYRAKNSEVIKSKKRASWKNWYDPKEQSRKRRTPEYRAKHRAYLNKPEYKEYKRQYDRIYRAKDDYGEFWEAGLLLLDIDAEVDSRMTDVEIRTVNGTLNKSLIRRRDYERLISNQS